MIEIAKKKKKKKKKNNNNTKCTHPHVFSNLYAFIYSVAQKKKIK